MTPVPAFAILEAAKRSRERTNESDSRGRTSIHPTLRNLGRDRSQTQVANRRLGARLRAHRHQMARGQKTRSGKLKGSLPSRAKRDCAFGLQWRRTSGGGGGARIGGGGTTSRSFATAGRSCGPTGRSRRPGK